jgi:hypothetical protein
MLIVHRAPNAGPGAKRSRGINSKMDAIEGQCGNGIFFEVC